MWFIGVEVEQEMSAPPPKKNPGSASVVYFDFRCFNVAVLATRLNACFPVTN